MATYYVYSGAGGAATGADWTNAFLTIAAALTSATTAGDVVKIHKTHQEEIAADANGTLTFGASIALVCVDKDASDALAVMGIGGWFGNSTLNRTITMTAPALKIYIYGLTLRTSGATGDSMFLSFGDGAHFEYEQCYFWQGNTSSSLSISTGTNDTNAFTGLRDCTFRFGATTQSLLLSGRVIIEGGSISTDGSAITTVFKNNATIDTNAPDVIVNGLDFAGAAASATLVGDLTLFAMTVKLSQCKLPSAYAAMASQTSANLSSAEVYILDCASGDTHGIFGYHNALGSVVSELTIKFTSTAAAQSWKVTTTSAASFYSPFRTPWIDAYHAGTSAITPRLEVLRDGSATAYNNNQVWGEFAAKVTTGSTLSTRYTDRMTVLGSSAAQASGTDTWDGENAAHWAGKVDSGSALTPAETGRLLARLCVGEPSVTDLYVDPVIRT